MRVIATVMLLVAAAVFVATRIAHRSGQHGVWLGYVEAAAEAAMVGGLADWFAVVALFRHPLRLPIPHTAIVAKRKDDIGANLGEFVRENFLAPEQLAHRVASIDPIGRAIAWVDRGNGDRAAELILRTMSTLTSALDDREVNDFVHSVVAERVRAVPTAPVVANIVETVMADGRRGDLIEAALAGVISVLDGNRATLRGRFGEESPWWVPDGIDERVFTRLYDGVRKLLADVRADPNHELRAHLDRRIDATIVGLRTDPQLGARVEAWRDEILASPELRRATTSGWASISAAIDEAAEPGSTSVLRTRIAEAARAAAHRLDADPVLRARADAAVIGAVRSFAERGGREMAAVIESTVQRWDADDTSARLEEQIGRDLQFVRINGTLVGGIAGLAIHAVARVL
jgi:uncharacterized membrane-anchored protein YjiN (DUF445 family)